MQHIAHADCFDGRHGTDMLKALWPSTLGYFLRQMMADVFTPEEIEAARQYVLANVLPRGQISAFRVAQTPYGVLPVTSLRNYPLPSSGSILGEPGLVKFVK